jgi:uncharacterized membrane protein YraQ (UPF0718 family)/copper chaperone CopZ
MLDAFLTELMQLTLTIAPLLLFGFVIAGLLHVLVRESLVVRHLGRPGWRSVWWATLVGVPLPLCSCSVVPVVASLRRKGASDGASVGFLISAPQIGADSFLLTQGLMGLGFACYRVGAAFVTALTAGLLIDAGKSGALPPPAPATEAEQAGRSLALKFWRHIQELVGSLATNLLVGLLLAALILVLLPEGLLAQWQGDSPWLAMLIALGVGIPLYVCATASTPIAAALVAKGLHPGAALVFLLAGPATNMVTLVMLRGSLGRRAITTYLAAISLVALLAGALMGFFHVELNQELTGHHDHGGPAGWWSQVAVAIVAGLLLMHYAGQLRQRFGRRKTREGELSERNLTLEVAGMTCAHCVGRVDQALRQTGLLEEVAVDLGAGQARLTLRDGTPAGEARRRLVEAVEAAGYTVPAGTTKGN